MHRDRAITCACDLELRPRASTRPACPRCRRTELGALRAPAHRPLSTAAPRLDGFHRPPGPCRSVVSGSGDGFGFAASDSAARSRSHLAPPPPAIHTAGPSPRTLRLPSPSHPRQSSTTVIDVRRSCRRWTSRTEREGSRIEDQGLGGSVSHAERAPGPGSGPDVVFRRCQVSGRSV